MDEKQFEKIEDYLNGSMSSEEKLRFEAELASNAELASALRLYQAIEEEMRSDSTDSAANNSLQSTLEGLTEKHFGTKPRKGEQQGHTHHQPAVSNTAEKASEKGIADVAMTDRKQNHRITISPWKQLAVAAILFSAMVMGAIWYVQKNEKEPNVDVTAKKIEVPKKMTEPDTASSVQNRPLNDVADSNENIKLQDSSGNSTTVQRTSQPIYTKQLNALYITYFKPDALPQPSQDAPDFDANESYKKGDYKAAIISFEEAIESVENPDSRTRGAEDEINRYLFYAYYYKAQSYTSVGNADKAIRDFRKALQKSPDTYWKSKVRWYLALVYVKKAQLKEAESFLNEVAKSNNAAEYKQKANRLLGELKNATKSR